MSWESAITVVSDHFGISREYILDYNRDVNTVNARLMCIALMRIHLDMNYVEIGKALNRNHATIIHAMTKFWGYMSVERRFREDYRKIESEFLKQLKDETTI